MRRHGLVLGSYVPPARPQRLVLSGREDTASLKGGVVVATTAAGGSGSPPPAAASSSHAACSDQSRATLASSFETALKAAHASSPRTAVPAAPAPPRPAPHYISKPSPCLEHQVLVSFLDHHPFKNTSSTLRLAAGQQGWPAGSSNRSRERRWYHSPACVVDRCLK